MSAMGMQQYFLFRGTLLREIQQREQDDKKTLLIDVVDNKKQGVINKIKKEQINKNK